MKSGFFSHRPAEDPALTRHAATAERVQKLFQQSENSLN